MPLPEATDSPLSQRRNRPSIATLPCAVTRQRLGQHFLADASWRARILPHLGLAPGQMWLEIGAGHGEMTRELARAGARVVAIELDARLVERLRAIAVAWPGVAVVAGDVLALELADLLPAGRWRAYGNLPYYITSPILRRLFEHADRLDSIHVVVQWEVAARLAARPGRRDYGYLSALAQFYARPEIALRIPPGAFRPRPKVTSALVSLPLPGERAALGLADEQAFLEFVQACFAQKRKTLRNNLRGRGDGERVLQALRALGLRGDARAEQLTLAQFAELYRALSVP